MKTDEYVSTGLGASAMLHIWMHRLRSVFIFQPRTWPICVTQNCNKRDDHVQLKRQKTADTQKKTQIAFNYARDPENVQNLHTQSVRCRRCGMYEYAHSKGPTVHPRPTRMAARTTATAVARPDGSTGMRRRRIAIRFVRVANMLAEHENDAQSHHQIKTQ